jgi:peptide/nickel transport system substrate-binding protein
MKRFSILLLVLVVALAVAPFSALAQDPGTGGPILEGQPGLENIGSFNPLRCSGTDCQRIYQFANPTVIGIDPATAEFVGGAPGALAESWEYNEDGTQLTIVLRQDPVWSDGEAITSEDVKFTYEAIKSGVIESDLTGYIDSIITAVEIVDDYTVIFSFAEADCTALNVVGYPVIPAHVFGFDGDYAAFDYTVLVGHPYDTEPTVSAGPFVWASSVPGQQINMAANQSYIDAPESGIIPAGYAAVSTDDFNVQLDRFLAGELNFMASVPLPRMQEVRDSGNQYFDFPANAYTYLGLNLADPANPVSALDEAGNLVEQAPHPIFGDVRVRQALAYAIDTQSIVNGVLNGEGSQIFGTEIPTSWAVSPDLAPYPFDLAQAEALLTEAGWVLNADGVRVCDGCLYAEAGAPFSFTLITNDSNPTRVDIGVLIQDQLRELGIEVDFQPQDFNTVVESITGQTHDAFILGWSLSFPSNPDQTQIFGAAADAVGSGFNTGSWINEEYIALNEEARVLPGCDQAARAEIYHRMQEIVYEEQPYVFLYAPNDMYAALPSVDGFGPYPVQPFWNVETWEISQ